MRSCFAPRQARRIVANSQNCGCGRGKAGRTTARSSRRMTKPWRMASRIQLPLWQPGGELDQFRSLMKPLRVEEIRSSGAEVIEPDSAQDDRDATELFRATVQQLQEDFVRNEPRLVQGLGIGWDALEEFRVREHPNLMLSVQVPGSGVGGALHCDVPVRVDPDRRIVFVKDPQRDLPRADRGGRALATLFDGERRRVAQAWRSAWDLAEGGRTATPLELAPAHR